MRVRLLQAADLPEVLRIEEQAMTDPWNEEMLLAEMQAGNAVSMVAVQGGRVCGYAFFRTCTPESELLRLAVGREWRHQGAASTLLDHALRSFSGQGYVSCFLEVRRSNEAALHLYAKAGFLQVGIRKKYYEHPVEDALQLCRNLVDTRGGMH